MRSLRWVVLFAIVAVAAVVTLVWVLVRQPFVIPAAQPATAATTAPVSSREITDEQQVSVTVTVGAVVSVSTPVAGRVTGTMCSPAQPLESGTAPVSVDGVPLLALGSSVPWWRDLSWGVRGADVGALHEELLRLGHDVSNDGDRIGRATIDAFAALSAQSGVPQQRGVIPLSEVIWLPSASTVMADCAIAIGDVVEAGDEIGTAMPELTEVRLSETASGTITGPRVLVIDGLEVAIDDMGTVHDPADRARLTGTPSVMRALSADGDGTVSGTVRLNEPVTVLVVPPSAVGTEDGVHGCMLADGAPRAVTLVGSRLGQTYVLADEQGEIGEVALQAPELSACP